MGRYERAHGQGQEEPTDPAPRPDEAVVKAELEEKVREALEELRPEDRRILSDRFYEDRSLAQIALATGRSAQAAWNQLHGAQDKLREVLLRKRFPPGP